MPAECNYEIYDKELLAVITGLKIWRAELEELPQKFLIVTDYQALEYFGTKKLLNTRQARWSGLMSWFNYNPIYRPGKENVVADVLLRKAQNGTG